MSSENNNAQSRPAVVTGGWLLLGAMTLIYFLANLQKVIVPGATFNELQQAFNVDAAQITRLGGAFMYAYALGQLLVGFLADRYGGVRVVIWGGVLFCVGSLLSGLNVSLGLLLCSRMMTGLGAASFYLSTVKEISKRPVSQLSMLVSIMLCVGYSGGIVGTAPFIAGIKAFGYRPMMLGAGIVTLLIYALFLGVGHKSIDPVNKDVKFRLSFFKAVFTRSNVFVIGSNGLCFGTYFAMQTVIGKKFLEDYCGMGTINAGYVLTAMMAIAAIDSLLIANLSRLCGNRLMPFIRLGGFGTMACTLALFLVPLSDYRAPWLAVVTMLLLSVTANGGAIYLAMLRLTNEDKCFGTIASSANFFAYIVTAIFGGFIGRLMDVFPPTLVGDLKIYGRESYLLVLGVMLFLTVIAAVFTCFLKEPKK